MGAIVYGIWMAVSLYLYFMGLLTVNWPALLLYFSLLLITNAVFLVFINRNWNLQFQDPGMTFVQIASGIFWGMVLLSQTASIARGGMLLLFVTAFFFGVFRLSTRQFLLLTLLASLAYGGLILNEWQMLSATARRTEITQWLFLTVVLLWMSFMGGYVARLRANLRKAMIKIERLAHQDDLTGTSNRRAITGSLDDALKQARETQAPLSLCMLDLDNFKQVNDRYGHLVGDEILREFVNRITHHLRWADFVHNKGITLPDEPEALGRFGGEEFLVILPDTDIDGAQQAAERLRAAICNKAFTTEAGEVHVSVSIGVTRYTDGDNDNDLLRRADQALYKSKQQGRNRVNVET
ncbi:MAG TPA: GGDEF domain-containing protein [Gammaproteobacteria bacterium]|nr:GGDEF domain-containing protein [Gammaproteobacteria bacterium]